MNKMNNLLTDPNQISLPPPNSLTTFMFDLYNMNGTSTTCTSAAINKQTPAAREPFKLPPDVSANLSRVNSYSSQATEGDIQFL